MAKRSIDERNDQWLEDQVVSEVPKDVELPKSVTIVLLQDVLLKITGSVTGNLYIFPGAGSIVSVDERDLPRLLAKKGGAPCCADRPSTYFQVLGR